MNVREWTKKFGHQRRGVRGQKGLVDNYLMSTFSNAKGNTQQMTGKISSGADPGFFKEG